MAKQLEANYIDNGQKPGLGLSIVEDLGIMALGRRRSGPCATAPGFSAVSTSGRRQGLGGGGGRRLRRLVEGLLEHMNKQAWSSHLNCSFWNGGTVSRPVSAPWGEGVGPRSFIFTILDLLPGRSGRLAKWSWLWGDVLANSQFDHQRGVPMSMIDCGSGSRRVGAWPRVAPCKETCFRNEHCQ